MKINFSETLKGLDGLELMVEEMGAKGDGAMVKKPIELRTICVNSLLGQHSDANGRPENVSGVEKMKRFLLAKKIHAGGGVEITTEECSLIKSMVEKSYGTLIVGIAHEMLEKG